MCTTPPCGCCSSPHPALGGPCEHKYSLLWDTPEGELQGQRVSVHFILPYRLKSGFISDSSVILAIAFFFFTLVILGPLPFPTDIYISVCEELWGVCRGCAQDECLHCTLQSMNGACSSFTQVSDFSQASSLSVRCVHTHSYTFHYK